MTLETKARSPEALSSEGLTISLTKEAEFRPEKLVRKPLRHVVFDLDRTLVDVDQKFGKVYVNQMHDCFGISYADAWEHYYMKVPGSRSRYQVESLLDRLGLDPDPNKINRVIRGLSHTRSAIRGKAFPGVSTALARIAKEGISLSISTFAKEQDAISKLKYARIDQYFKLKDPVGGKEYAIAGRDSMGEGRELKKGADQLKLIATAIGVPFTDFLSQAAFVTDSVEDLEEVGMVIRKMGLSNSPHERVGLINAGAYPVFDHRQYESLVSFVLQAP